ncbi:MAG: hypothetical protein IJW26_00035, partial [Clostridia bacterium]|nr:hypothetical protein [Clostridia bacterium]
YVNFRVLVTTTTDLTEVPLQFYWGGGNYADKNPSTIPVNTWVNLYFDRNLSMERYSAYHAAAERLPQSSRSAFEIDTTDIGSQYNQEGMFTLYVDYISYDRDMRIAVNGVDGYSLVDYADTSGVLTPYAVSYSKVTSKLKQEVTLSTALTNGTINYTVLDPDGEEVVLTNGNTFTPTKLGSYTVKASCDDYVLQIADTAEISGYSYKSKQYGELVFEVVGAEIDATMAETATIGIDESVEITAVTDAEYTLSYSAKLPNGDLIELDSNVLPIGLVGDYEVYVTAYDSENLAVGKQTLPLTVKAMTAAQVRDSGIFATFGQDGSEKAAYDVTATYTTKWVFDWTGKGDATSIANGTLSDGTTTWKADWHDKYQGRYGVISTRSQFAGYDTTTSYGVFLRSDVVLTATYNQPFCGGDYNTSQARKEGAFNNTNWDYLSIPIYLPKPANATEDYTNIYLRYAVGGAIKVPYDTWYELKIDKYWLMINYYDQAGYIFRYGASNGYPLFFMSLANASEDALKLAQDQEIFIDGIKLAKYDAQFTSAKLLGTDSTGATNDAEVAIEQAFTVDASGYVVNAEGTATPFCFKPELYLGETQVAITDITAYQTSKSNITLNYSNGVFTLSKFTLNSGAPRTDYFIGLWIKYTDANSTVYYKYFGIRPQVTLATTA